MKKVMIGMSGGVDSSVAAAVLIEKGYEVVGVTLKVWSGESYEEESSCCNLSDVEDARRVAEKLNIPHYVFNFKDVFENKVIYNFIEEYKKGRTPNPCIRCNKYIKFGHMLEKAESMGFDYVATGHYAKIEFDEESKRYVLKKSSTDKKDQTYALYNFTQRQLSKTLMPLSSYTKDEVREMAKNLGLGVSSKPDSQEICFVPDNKHGNFIRKRAKIPKGKFVDLEGNILGHNEGIVNYTIGQRKGLGIALGRPVFVVDIDAKKNQIVLGDEKLIFKKELTASEVNYILIESLKEPIKVSAKIRYGAKEATGIVYPIEGNRIKMVFDKPQRAITPGQSIVLYSGNSVLGGGIID